DELFALIVLKNVFPKEYEELEHDQGYLYKILNKRDDLITQYLEALNKKKFQREDLKNQLLTHFSDFLAVNVPKSYSFDTDTSNGQFMYTWYKNQDSVRQVKKGYSKISYTF